MIIWGIYLDFNSTGICEVGHDECVGGVIVVHVHAKLVTFSNNIGLDQDYIKHPT